MGRYQSVDIYKFIYGQWENVALSVLIFTQLKVCQYVSCTESFANRTKDIEFMGEVKFVT